MSEEATPEPRDGIDVRQLARELIAEDIDLDDIYEDRISSHDTRASRGEPIHRAVAVQLPHRRSDASTEATPEKVVLRPPNFGPMLLAASASDSERAATLAAASPHEATTVSLASRSRAPWRRRAITWLALLVVMGIGAGAIAHQLLAPTESSTP